MRRPLDPQERERLERLLAEHEPADAAEERDRAFISDFVARQEDPFDRRIEEGGGTKFDSGFTVTPKKGRAVLWPSTFDDQPFVQDERTHHEALPVTKGVKYAANAWVHQFDFMGPYASGCTG